MLISPGRMILLGFFLVFFGFTSAFAMVMRLVEPSFLLSFLSYGASLVGLFLGIIGVASYRGGGHR